ncbi:hypothetical protein GpartN1_g1835.t1 [Galdieria partita]|uniref:DNA repair protein Rad4 n=1 Tax=Galdieria partita TaxID=83374 RepID=A0A9C7UNL1_9RHOD|nr:hypothetical protein GpartN1_g1835.t1 [Galdieria partita]
MTQKTKERKNGKKVRNHHHTLQVEQKQEEEYQDIEWSEVSIPVDNQQEEATVQETRTGSTSIIECSSTEEAASKESPYNREDRLQAVRMHKTHLLILLSSLIKLNQLASDPLVIGSSLSVIPRDCLLTKEDLEVNVEQWKEKCRRIVLFCCHFVGKQTMFAWQNDGNYVFWQPFHIQQWLESPRPLASIFVVFVCAIFRGLGMRCRLVQSFIPFSKQPWWTRNPSWKENRKYHSEGRPSNINLSQNDSFWWLFAPWMMELVLPGSLYRKEISFDSLPCIYWLEVYSSILQRWVHIDPFHILIDEACYVESSYKKWKWHPFRERMIYPVYITAIENVKVDEHNETTILRDVTLRYISLSTIRSQRMKDRFWEKTMEAFSNPTKSWVQSDICICNEQREWEYWNNKEPIPHSIHKLKGHPQYVLEMHLKKYETIYPKDSILGYCGEHPVYPRSNVHILHTRDGWIREMRQVMKDQIASKRVKTRKSSTREGEEQTELFGIWQTEPFTPPSAENGIVPKNERGQVDLWSSNHLPRGCIHVRHSNAAIIAKRLSLDYAPAMIGFDIRQGRSVPILDGIVIAKEYQDIIEDACRQDWQHKENEQMKKRYEQALQLWKACIRHVQSQLRVQQKYGGLLQDDLSYEKGLKKRARISWNTHSSNTCDAIITTTLSDHIHEFSEEQMCEENSLENKPSSHTLWYKQCSTCGLRITFEKIE